MPSEIYAPTLRSEGSASRNGGSFFLKSLFTCDSLWLFILFASLLLRFPYSTYNFFSFPSNITFFDHASVGLVAAGVLLCNVQWFRNRPSWFPLTCVGVMSLSALAHIFLKSSWFEPLPPGTAPSVWAWFQSLDIITAEGLMFALVPLIAMLKFRQIFRILPFFIAFCWFLDFYHATWSMSASYQFWDTTTWAERIQRFCDGSMTDGLVSIAGNRNWRAALLVATTLPTAWLAFRWCAKIADTTLSQRIMGSIGALIIVIPSIFYHRLMDSRASVVAFLVAFSIFALALILQSFHRNKKMQFTILAGIVFAGMLFSTALFAVAHQKITDKLLEVTAEDVRVPMWRAACTLLKEEVPSSRPEAYPIQGYRWLTGVGSTFFEDEYVVCRMPDYFTRTMPAERTDYPHNNSFYVAGYLGIPAWACFFILGIIPMICVFFRIIRAPKIPWKWAVLLFSAISLYWHAHFDLVLEYFPMAAIYLLSIGVFMRAAWPVTYTPIPSLARLLSNVSFPQLALRGTAVLMGAFFLVLGGTHAYCMLQSSTAANDVMMWDNQIRKLSPEDTRISQAVGALHKAAQESLVWNPRNIEVANLALMHTSMFMPANPGISAKYLRFIGENCMRYNYCNINQIGFQMARRTGNVEAEESYILRQIRAYPMGIIGWLNLYEFYRNRNEKWKADYIHSQIEKLCKVRGHSMELAYRYVFGDLRSVPRFDVRPHNDTQNWKKPDVYPAHDKHLWPDYSFIYHRIGKGLKDNLKVDDRLFFETKTDSAKN